MDTTKHPLDFDALSKGSMLTVEELETALMCSRDDDNFLLRVLTLRAQIEDRCGILCRQDGTTLRLMTDAEAVQWLEKQGLKNLKGLQRTAVRLKTRIDPRQLSEADKRRAEHAAVAFAAVSQAALAEKAKHKKFFSLMQAALPSGDD